MGSSLAPAMVSCSTIMQGSLQSIVHTGISTCILYVYTILQSPSDMALYLKGQLNHAVWGSTIYVSLHERMPVL